MMTLEEIRSAQINPTAAREAYNHADRRLMDTLETKKFFEQKAFTLFGAYVTAATALLGIGVALLKDNYWNYLSTPFCVRIGVCRWCNIFRFGAHGQNIWGAG